ncbi:MAG: hypothetical protein NWR72_02340 [Bacteroidia bacterium]|nr:hypothetical protein [Bacteroidia bacterium]
MIHLVLLFCLCLAFGCKPINSGKQEMVQEETTPSEAICNHIEAHYRVLDCNVSIQDSLVHISLGLGKTDGKTYRRVTILEQCILISAFDLLPKGYAVLFETKPIIPEDTFTQSLFHRRMPYPHEAVRAIKIDSEVNPCFYEAKQHILKEIAPRDIYAIDQCYQAMVVKENKEYDPYGPTFIFLIQALTIERRDTPESHVYLDQLKELQSVVASIFDSNYPEIAEKLSFFLDFC